MNTLALSRTLIVDDVSRGTLADRAVVLQGPTLVCHWHQRADGRLAAKWVAASESERSL